MPGSCSFSAATLHPSATSKREPFGCRHRQQAGSRSVRRWDPRRGFSRSLTVNDPSSDSTARARPWIATMGPVVKQSYVDGFSAPWRGIC
jgi:hypothetical protein